MSTVSVTPSNLLSPHFLQVLDCSQQPLLPCRDIIPFQPHALSAHSLITPHLDGVYFHMHLLTIDGTPMCYAVLPPDDEKSVPQGYTFVSRFDSSLFKGSGTLLYGMATNVNGKPMWYFEDIMVYKGDDVMMMPFKEKLRTIYHIFSKEYKKDEVLDPATFALRPFVNFPLANVLEEKNDMIYIYPDDCSQSILIYTKESMSNHQPRQEFKSRDMEHPHHSRRPKSQRSRFGQRREQRTQKHSHSQWEDRREDPWRMEDLANALEPFESAEGRGTEPYEVDHIRQY
jgi:hypothetical protein